MSPTMWAISKTSYAGVIRIGLEGYFSALRAVERPRRIRQIEAWQRFFENHISM